MILLRDSEVSGQELRVGTKGRISVLRGHDNGVHRRLLRETRKHSLWFMKDFGRETTF